MNSLLKNILFIDIETVSLTNSFKELPPRLQEAWYKKALQLSSNIEDIEAFYFEKAAIYAEFGKIVAIGLGYFRESESKELTFRAKAISNHDEKELLLEFCSIVKNGFKAADIILCAHNGKEFDFPYLCRRMLINCIPIPSYLTLSGKKPWQVKHIDTLELWKFGDRKSYTSLDLLAAVFDIETSKTDMDGSKVNDAYYNLNQLEKISAYCKRDVLVLAQLFLKMNCLPLPKAESMVLL